MATVVGQRYEIYNYGNVINDVPRRGEIVTITGTVGYGETAVQLLGDGKKNVRELYERFAAAVLTPGTVANKQDKITATGPDNLLTAPASAGGQPGIKSVGYFVLREDFDDADWNIHNALNNETRARQEAYRNLQDAINLLAPEGLEDLPDLLASKAPVNSPVFTGVPKVPSKKSVATDNGTLIATEAQVAAKANSYGGNANRVQSAANADHATTAGSANVRTTASNTAITSVNEDSTRLATWADVYRTVMHMLMDPPSIATSIKLETIGTLDPLFLNKNSYYSFTAVFVPAGSSGIVDWTLSGPAFNEGRVFFSEMSNNRATIQTGEYSPNETNNFTLTARLRYNGATASFNRTISNYWIK
jgi:hypothetical protein